MKLEVKKLGINGEGIAYEKRKPIFIEGALPEEEVEVKIKEDKGKYAYAQLEKILVASPQRIKSECKNNHCHACTLKALDYKSQLIYKKEIFKETINKYSDINEDLIGDIIPSPKQYGYRNALKQPMMTHNSKLECAMYKSNSNYLIPVSKCIVHEESLEMVKKDVLKVLNKYHFTAYEHKLKKGIRYLVIRGFKENFQVSIISGNDVFKKEVINDLLNINFVKSLWQSVNTKKNTIDLFGKSLIFLGGKKKLGFNLKGIRFYLSPKSFFQLNTSQALNLYDYVTSLIKDCDLLVEAYCGIGAMSLMNASKAKKVIGIEYVSDAISNANLNKKINKLDNIEFICGDAGQEMKKISNKQTIDYLIVDPPRNGLDDLMLKCIITSKINNLIYVSCNPATLAKNLNVLKRGYYVKSIKVFDMFVNSAHVETVVLLSRKDDR